MAEKPTTTKTSSFADLFPDLNDLDDLLGVSNPLSKVAPEPEHQHKSHHGADPELKRASAADTRRATAGINISAQGRDALRNMNPDIEDDEIDDAEALRRAGLSPNNNDDEDVRPVPREPGTDVVIAPKDLIKAVNNAVKAPGFQNPDWHAIRNLPGYLLNKIRSMGRKTFGMVTTTDIEDIITVANLGGRGPNTTEEVNAVYGWILKNAEFVRDLDFDFSQALPGYQPEVKEYRTPGLRFHVVVDQDGKYIYAYPEGDAITPDSWVVPDLGLPPPPPEFARLPRFESVADEMRSTLSLLESKQVNTYTYSPYQIFNESKETKVKKTLAEEIRQHLNKIEVLQEEVDAARDLQEIMEELKANEAYRGKASKARYMDPEAQAKRMGRKSSLAPLLSKHPGGSRLLSWLHKQMGLGSQADWSEKKAQHYYDTIKPHFPPNKQSDKDISTKWGSGVWGDNVKDARQLWMVIKSHPENYVVFIGERGVGAILPKPGYIERKKEANPDYSPEGDQNLIYVYAFFTQDQQWINTNPAEAGIFDPKTGKYHKRGGLVKGTDPNPNMINTIREMIGKISSSWAAYPAEANYPHPPERDLELGPPEPLSKENPSRETEKVAQRKELRAPSGELKSRDQLYGSLIAKITPVLGKLARSSQNRINQSIKRAIDGQDFERASQLSKAGTDLMNFVTSINGPSGISANMNAKLLNAIKHAAEEHDYDPKNEEELKAFMNRALRAGPETQSILDAFRSTLAGGRLE